MGGRTRRWRWRTYARDQRAVSTIIGTVLVLFIVMLAMAGILLGVLPIHNDVVVRLASVLVLCVSATMWLREAQDLLRFIVAIMGRLPIITPAFVYAAVLGLVGIMVVPPFIAAVAAERPLRPPLNWRRGRKTRES